MPIAGVVILAWSGFSLGSHALFLSRHGIEKRATVLKFQYISGTPKGGYTFYYMIDIDGAQQHAGFPMRLREGSSIALLASPSDPADLVLGHRGDSPFDVFAHEIGSRTFAYILVLFYPTFFFVLLPVAIRDLWRQYRSGAGLFRRAQQSII